MNLKPLLALALSLLGLSVWYNWAFEPQRLHIEQLQQDNQRLQQELQAAYAAQAALPQLRLELTTKQLEQAAFTQRVPTQEDIYGLVRFLGRQASRHGVELSQVRRAIQQSPIPGVKVTQLPLQTTSAFNALYRYLGEVLNNPRYLNLSELSLRLEGSKVQTTLQVDAYSYMP